MRKRQRSKHKMTNACIATYSAESIFESTSFPFNSHRLTHSISQAKWMHCIYIKNTFIFGVEYGSASKRYFGCYIAKANGFSSLFCSWKKWSKETFLLFTCCQLTCNLFRCTTFTNSPPKIQISIVIRKCLWNADKRGWEMELDSAIWCLSSISRRFFISHGVSIAHCPLLFITYSFRTFRHSAKTRILNNKNFPFPNWLPLAFAGIFRWIEFLSHSPNTIIKAFRISFSPSPAIVRLH